MRTIVAACIVAAGTFFSCQQRQDAETLFQTGVIEFENEEYERALKFFNRSLNERQDDPRAYYYRGMTKYKMGRLREAIEDFDKALTLDAGDADSYFARGVARYRLGDVEAGCKDVERAMKKGHTEAAQAYHTICQDTAVVQ
jgi:tetratricopeptide (TPR) repeat protein